MSDVRWQQAVQLWTEQCTEWDMLQRGNAGLLQAETRTLTVNGRSVRLQHNPARAVSAAATVDPKAIAARPCFLCGDNLPPQQRGLDLGPEWVLLCNPAPIFAPHFVLASRAHVPQRVTAALHGLLRFARQLGPDALLFYNGPQAGASAPDHLHLQAAAHDGLPFAELVAQHVDWGSEHLGCSTDPAWPTVLARGGSESEVAAAMLTALDAFARVCPHDPEPRLNLFARFDGQQLLSWFVPRRAHRPDCYGDGPGQRLISPGAVEIGGQIITPRLRDFQQTQASEIVQVYSDVHVTSDAWASLRALIR